MSSSRAARPLGSARADRSPPPALDGERYSAVQSAPDHEGPVRAVPQAAEQHGQHQVDVGARCAAAIAAERHVEIVAQPGRQRDVPAPPEIGEADRRVRHAEVVRQAETEAQRGADRDGRVAREVAEDLAGECERAEPGVDERRPGAGLPKTRSADGREHAIGEHDFLEEAERSSAPDPSRAGRAVACRGRCELRHETASCARSGPPPAAGRR